MKIYYIFIEAEQEARLRTPDSIVDSAASQEQLTCADWPSLAPVSFPLESPSSGVNSVVGWPFKGSVAQNKGSWFTTNRFMSLTAFPHSATQPMRNQPW